MNGSSVVQSAEGDLDGGANVLGYLEIDQSQAPVERIGFSCRAAYGRVTASASAEG